MTADSRRIQELQFLKFLHYFRHLDLSAKWS